MVNAVISDADDAADSEVSVSVLSDVLSEEAVDADAVDTADDPEVPDVPDATEAPPVPAASEPPEVSGVPIFPDAADPDEPVPAELSEVSVSDPSDVFSDFPVLSVPVVFREVPSAAVAGAVRTKVSVPSSFSVIPETV